MFINIYLYQKRFVKAVSYQQAQAKDAYKYLEEALLSEISPVQKL